MHSRWWMNTGLLHYSIMLCESKKEDELTSSLTPFPGGVMLPDISLRSAAWSWYPDRHIWWGNFTYLYLQSFSKIMHDIIKRVYRFSIIHFNCLSLIPRIRNQHTQNKNETIFWKKKLLWIGVPRGRLLPLLKGELNPKAATLDW